MKIEGKNPIKEALNSSITLTKLYVQKGLHDTQDLLSLAKKKSIHVVFSTKQELDRMSETGRHQGLIALGENYDYYSVEEIIKAKGDEPLFLIILDNIEDPHNLGSVIRVAECLGVHGIVIPNKRSAVVNSTVLRVSAGAAAHVKIALVNNINDVIRKLTDDFVTVMCADMDGQSIFETDLKEDLAIVIGNEGHGVKHLTQKLCNKTISIPQKGKVNSLNASVAAGIICSEVVRQRLK